MYILTSRTYKQARIDLIALCSRKVIVVFFSAELQKGSARPYTAFYAERCLAVPAVYYYNPWGCSKFGHLARLLLF